MASIGIFFSIIVYRANTQNVQTLTAVDLTAARFTLLANIDIGLMATAGRERVVRAAERIAVAKAREAIL